jgi:hypothetical protein
MMKKRFCFLGIACLALAMVFAACPQSTDNDSGGNIWDATHSYGTNRLAGNTVYPSGTDENTASIRYEFEGNAYTIRTKTGASWEGATVVEKGTYVTNGYTRSVDFYRTQLNPLVFGTDPFMRLQDALVNEDGTKAKGELMAIVMGAAAQAGGLVNEAQIIGLVSNYFINNPNQFAKLPVSPYTSTANLDDLTATESQVEDWWKAKLLTTGYEDRTTYVRDVFIQLKASPTTPLRIDCTPLNTPNYYTLVNTVPYL